MSDSSRGGKLPVPTPYPSPGVPNMKDPTRHGDSGLSKLTALGLHEALTAHWGFKYKSMRVFHLPARGVVLILVWPEGGNGLYSTFTWPNPTQLNAGQVAGIMIDGWIQQHAKDISNG